MCLHEFNELIEEYDLPDSYCFSRGGINTYFERKQYLKSNTGRKSLRNTHKLNDKSLSNQKKKINRER